MKKIYCILNFLLCTNLLVAQFICDNIEVVGIYSNNFHTNQLSIMLTNKSVDHDGNFQVYTSLQLITEQGDTILIAPAHQTYTLPTSVQDTFVYNIELHKNFGTIYDLPDSFCGKLVTEFPHCEIDFCEPAVIAPGLPQQVHVCSDLKVIGLYPTAHGGISNYSMLLTYTDENFEGEYTAYSTFEFIDNNQVPICQLTNPSYSMPRFIGDTVIVHLDFFEPIESDFCAILKTTLPDCEINYCPTATSTEQNYKSLFQVFPNPVKDQIEISDEFSVEHIFVYNYLGQLVLENEQNLVDVNLLDTGIYIVRIKLKNDENIFAKIMKQ